MSHPKANNTSFKPGNKSGGRPKKTDEERAAYKYLCEKTQDAARRLVELEASGDEKIALAAVLGHLRIVVGDLTRLDATDPDAAKLSLEELKRLAQE